MLTIAAHLLAPSPPPPRLERSLLVEAPDRIRQITDALVHEGARGTLIEPRGARLPVFAAGKVEEAELPYRWGIPRAPHGQRFTLRIGGALFGYQLEIGRARFDDGLLATDEATTLRVLKSRASRRVAVSGIRATVLDAAERMISGAEVVELCRHGLLLQLPPGEGLRPGEVVDLDLHPHRGRTFRVGALVVHVTAGGRAGVRVIATGDAAYAAWASFAEAFLYPTTRRGHAWAAATWSLYERSGYFDLSQKRPAHFAPLRAAFSVASRRLDLAPELGAQITWPSPRGVEASVSLLRVYSGTSLLYQVARRKDGPQPARGRQMLRAINQRALEPLLDAPEHRWLLVYVQQDGARWSRLAYRDFALQLPRAAGTCLLPFRALELCTRREVSLRPDTDVTSATPADREALLERVRTQRGSAYADCLDLTPAGLDLERVATPWRANGFRRTREVLVARRGRAAAAAVVETADPGLHLFGLLDCVRVYRLTPGGGALYPDLLEAARGHFRDQGRERYVYFAEGDQARTPAPERARDLGLAHLVGISAPLLPDLLEHLALVTAPRGGEAAEVSHG